jgi:hypothetical protein
VSILLRLVRTLVVLVLFLLVLGVVAVVLGRPMVERVAARSIEDRLGTPVSVSIEAPIRPAIARGNLGKVTVRAKQFERNGLRLAGARATYRGVTFSLGDLLSRKVRLRYASVGFQADLTAGALDFYLKPVLAAHGLPAKKLRITVGKGSATVRVGTLHAVVGAKVAGKSSIRLVPRSGSRELERALAAPIPLGPLPDGVHLTAIVLRKGRATLVGAGAAGKINA